MKFILLVLSLQGSPQYAVGPFPDHLSCSKQPVAQGYKAICIPHTTRL